MNRLGISDTNLLATVGDFISGDPQSWNFPEIPVLNDLFAQIRSLHLPLQPCADRFIWKPDSKGSFSAASAWEVVRTRGNQIGTNGVLFFWNQRIPPRRSMFCWRLIHRKIPTDDIVITKGKGVCLASCCSLCNFSNAEDIHHVFFQCAFAALGLVFQKIFSSNVSLYLYVYDGFYEQMEVGAAFFLPQRPVPAHHLGWAIWLERNAVRFEEIQPNVTRCKTIILKWVSESGSLSKVFNNMQEAIKIFNLPCRPSPAPNQLEVLWVKPPSGWVKLHVDGASKGNPGIAGYGGVFRDHTGCFLGGFAGSIRISLLKFQPTVFYLLFKPGSVTYGSKSQGHDWCD